VIFDIVEYNHNGMDNAECVGKPNMQDMQEVLIPKKRRRVLLASLSQSSIGQKCIVELKN
jgi:hypothetical protein